MGLRPTVVRSTTSSILHIINSDKRQSLAATADRRTLRLRRHSDRAPSRRTVLIGHGRHKHDRRC